MLISERYDDSLVDLKYGYGYDIRIHAIQSAILILYYDTMGYEIKINDINFGYYCIMTEKLIKEFQYRNYLVANGILTRETWLAIFTVLKHSRKYTLVETAPRRVGIHEVLDYIEEITSPNNNSDVIIDDVDYDNISGEITSTNNAPSYTNSEHGESFIDYIKQNLPSGFDTSFFEHNSYNNLDSAKVFDELTYLYIVSGGSVYNNVSFGYNIGNGGEYWHDEYLTPKYSYSDGESNRDYDYIYNLLSNSIYEGNIDLSPMTVSQSTTDYGKYNGNYTTGTNAPYFATSTGESQLRKAKFDLTIVYGAKGTKARKIIDVMPIAITQELDASGEPIYDIYEFIAKDVVDSI